MPKSRVPAIQGGVGPQRHSVPTVSNGSILSSGQELLDISKGMVDDTTDARHRGEIRQATFDAQERDRQARAAAKAAEEGDAILRDDIELSWELSLS